GDRARDPVALGVVAPAVDDDGDELGRSLAVPHDRLRQLHGRELQRTVLRARRSPIAGASGTATSSSASCSGGRRGSSERAIGAIAALPVATMTKLSLVEVSPSIVMRLNDAAATLAASSPSSIPSSGASVAMKPSIVAMLGAIMPAPLAMPVIVTGTPSTSRRHDAAFGTVSVVMIARIAASHPEGDSAATH